MGCKPHIIAEKTLLQLVAAQIRAHARLVSYNENRIIQSIVAQQTSENTASKKTFSTELKSHKKRLEMLNKLIEKLCEDRVTGVVPETVFKNLVHKYEEERIDKEQAVKSLETRMANLNENTSTVTAWAKQIKQYAKLEEPDAETLMMLIDKIVVSEAQIIDGERVHEIQIVYNHVGDMTWLNQVEASAVATVSEAITDKAEVAHAEAV